MSPTRQKPISEPTAAPSCAWNAGSGRHKGRQNPRRRQGRSPAELVKQPNC
jgi:hypothetical protein